MKVAMLTTTGERCGIAAYTRALIDGLAMLPNTTTEVIAITEGKQPREHYIEQANRLNAPDIDVVHIQHEHSFWGGILPRASAYWELRYLIKKPVVLTAHTTYSLAKLLKADTERRPIQWLAKQMLIRNRAYRDRVDIAPFVTAMTIVHTAAARRELIERGAASEYVHVVPTGIPNAEPAPTGGRSFREKYGLTDRMVITIFGYIAPNKGYELTMEILPQLPANVTLVIAGGARLPSEEPYAASVKALVERSGLTDRVVITGFLTDTDVAEAMVGSDLVLAPHTWATGSYSVTLPLTHGRPVLASDVDCFKEIAARMDCIALFQANNAADYRARLVALLEDSDRRTALAQSALAYSNRFSWPNVARMTRRIYEQTIAIHARGHRPTWTGSPHAHFKSDEAAG